jgi:hypothetical protein
MPGLSDAGRPTVAPKPIPNTSASTTGFSAAMPVALRMRMETEAMARQSSSPGATPRRRRARDCCAGGAPAGAAIGYL